jgi:hypothetical protein
LAALALNAATVTQREAHARVAIGTASGLPRQRLQLHSLAVADLRLWTQERGSEQEWRRQVSLDASLSTDAHFTLDPTTGDIELGDGVHGRIPDPGAVILAAYGSTRGASGSLGAGVAWRIADVPANHATLGADFNPVLTDVVAIDGVAVALDGADAASFARAAGRAAESVWAHELLVQLSGERPNDTLDQLDPAAVRASPVPARGATPLDLERLALQVPGTCVRRARAWASLDPSAPGILAAGTVTVVIMPELPPRRPTASARLLRRVRQYLARRCILGSRLIVTGPSYVEISVTAAVAAMGGADATRVSADVARALDEFLDPLEGGPARRGWPFGRDVFRSELLATIDRVRGVDHVLSLSITADGRVVECGNACISAAAVACGGIHSITVTA